MAEHETDWLAAWVHELFLRSLLVAPTRTQLAPAQPASQETADFGSEAASKVLDFSIVAYFFVI